MALRSIKVLPVINAMLRFAAAVNKASALWARPKSELTEQDWTRKTEDFKEGVKSYAEKRPGNWKGR